MTLSVKGLALTAGILWAAAVFLTGILNLIWPGYGVAFLDMMRSLYPGYAGVGGFLGLIIGTLYALVDGAISGAIFAWVYNRISRPAAVPGAGAS